MTKLSWNSLKINLKGGPIRKILILAIIPYLLHWYAWKHWPVYTNKLEFTIGSLIIVAILFFVFRNLISVKYGNESQSKIVKYFFTLLISVFIGLTAGGFVLLFANGAFVKGETKQVNESIERFEKRRGGRGRNINENMYYTHKRFNKTKDDISFRERFGKYEGLDVGSKITYKYTDGRLGWRVVKEISWENKDKTCTRYSNKSVISCE